MSKKTKVAVIGVGGISEVHIAGYKANPDVELYAFCDINEKRLKEKGARHGVTRLYTDEATMLKECPEIEAVSVCTWNAAHAPCSIMALNAGKHVLCEKPMALNTQEANAMKEAADKNGKLLMIGFMRRFSDNMEVLKDFVNAGDFGEIYYAKARYIRRNGAPGGWFGNKEFSGGGPLIDLGVHVIDMVRYIMGKPKPVSVYGATYDKLGNRPGIKSLLAGYTASDADSKTDIFNVEDMATALVRFDNGAILHIEVSFSMNIPKEEENVEIYGSKSGAVLYPDLKMYTQQNDYLTNVSLAQNPKMGFEYMFVKETAHFIKCITEGMECRNPAEDGVVLMQILDAVYESARTGHEVIIK
ncbi:MAG: Gfo/Idh/MocA family oxidoreductase [Abditibacteriota bacterium]|nr:Gfo/Idh/MocA family oxidoreductase [Abditibacteriota bacterium]